MSFNFGGSIAAQFAEALAERARAGVRVRVLLDSFGSRHMGKAAKRLLLDSGVCLKWFRPLCSVSGLKLSSRRGHRKVVVCDNRVGFTGGVGIDDRWNDDVAGSPGRRDTHFRILGPAVNGLESAFLTNWAEASRGCLEQEHGAVWPRELGGGTDIKLVAAGAYATSNNIAEVFAALLNIARHHLRISTAYFIPDRRTLDLLCSAARRQVQVDLLVNGPRRDKWITYLSSQSRFQTLLDAGVIIWTYEPAMLHAKLLSVDGHIACVGSANLNSRSLFHDEELNLVIRDRAVVRKLDEQFVVDLHDSSRIYPGEWARRGFSQKMGEIAASKLSRYL
jgi:cardiolipin synthase